MDGMINIGLPKGRFLAQSQTLENTLRELKEDKKKQLTFYYLKARDIPSLIYRGKLSYGVTCDEWVIENDVELREICDTGWCYSKISLISQTDNYELTRSSHVASPFPKLTRAYFGRKNKHPVIEEVSGSGEFLVPFAYDLAVDVIETGATIARLGLKSVGEPLLLSSTRMWGNCSIDNPEFEETLMQIFSPESEPVNK